MTDSNRKTTDTFTLLANAHLPKEQRKTIEVKDVPQLNFYAIRLKLVYKPEGYSWISPITSLLAAFAPNFYMEHGKKDNLGFKLKHRNQIYFGLVKEHKNNTGTEDFLIYSREPITDSTLIEKIVGSVNNDTKLYPFKPYPINLVQDSTLEGQVVVLNKESLFYHDSSRIYMS